MKPTLPETKTHLQLRTCLNCHYNPMTEAEYAAARVTGNIKFICKHNGYFYITDINFAEMGYTHYYKKRVVTSSPEHL